MDKSATILAYHRPVRRLRRWQVLGILVPCVFLLLAVSAFLPIWETWHYDGVAIWTLSEQLSRALRGLSIAHRLRHDLLTSLYWGFAINAGIAIMLGLVVGAVIALGTNLVLGQGDRTPYKKE